MAQSLLFDITPEAEGSKLQFVRRQLFVKATPILPGNVDLTGKTAIVTGANGDIGLECCRQLLQLGLTKLILAVRDESKGTAARSDLIADVKLGSDRVVEIWKLDYASYESVVAFAQRAEQLPNRVDIVILNAAVTRGSFSLNPTTGHEEDVQTNYLSSVLLLVLFVGIFKKATLNAAEGARRPPGRIVLVSSDTAAWAQFKEKDQRPLLEAFDKKPKNFDIYERYYTTKLLGQLFVTEIAKRVPPSLAIVNCANPGLCYSGLQRELSTVMATWIRFFGRAPTVGARSLVSAATVHDEKSHGQYIEDGKLRPMAPYTYSQDAALVVQQLWNETMQELSFAGVHEIMADLK
ncbi:NAD(P)-binding protein [Nemania sp. FL0916]|nr:NAD(P)-binding protein [Nemania sp. FL0916]